MQKALNYKKFLHLKESLNTELLTSLNTYTKIVKDVNFREIINNEEILLLEDITKGAFDDSDYNSRLGDELFYNGDSFDRIIPSLQKIGLSFFPEFNLDQIGLTVFGDKEEMYTQLKKFYYRFKFKQIEVHDVFLDALSFYEIENNPFCKIFTFTHHHQNYGKSGRGRLYGAFLVTLSYSDVLQLKALASSEDSTKRLTKKSGIF